MANDGFVKYTQRQMLRNKEQTVLNVFNYLRNLPLINCPNFYPTFFWEG